MFEKLLDQIELSQEQSNAGLQQEAPIRWERLLVKHLSILELQTKRKVDLLNEVNEDG